MKKFLKSYLTFNNRERNGIIILLAIIALLIVSIRLAPYLIKSPTADFISYEKYLKELNANSILDSSDELTHSIVEMKMDDSNSAEKNHLFIFNPNTANADDFKKLGFSEKLIQTISNYRNKGGHFLKKEDLKKIYGMKDGFFILIEPYITLDNNQTHPVQLIHQKDEDEISKQLRSVKNANPLTELNAADSLSLLQLKGIGPSFAHRIISYRNKLGGFHKMEQLKEVFGLDSLMFANISPQLEIKGDKLARMNINTISMDILKRHPYVKYNIANLIINYRNQHGPYKSVEEIKKIHLLTDELYVKLAPYLKVEN